MGDQEALVLEQEMSISREEFLRVLPAAVAPDRFSIDGGEVRRQGEDRSWRMVLRALADRRLGQLRLPRLQVQIYLSGYSRADSDSFLGRFELYFRRAGG
ncbi:MAG: hypothetical protein OEW24_10265 [Chloroflexota bacterium]|nr:hypothetical protein [Chloroflexota bacterium]